MKISSSTKITSLVVASVLAMASVAHAGMGNNGNSNACAVGNHAPEGANCTNP